MNKETTSRECREAFEKWSWQNGHYTKDRYSGEFIFFDADYKIWEAAWNIRPMPDKGIREALELAKDHVSELEDAWQRGVISEHDGQGGTRSNRNVEVRYALQQALDQLKEV